MQFILAVLIASVAFVGCQKQEQAPDTQASQIPQDRRNAGHQLILKSLQDLQNKDLKATIASLEQSIKVDPVDPEAYLLLAQILINVKEYQHAAEFLDQTVRLFPDNGSFYYMMSIANKMNGKKLPAVLAARRSVEIYKEAKDKDNFLKSAVLLQDLINMPDAPASAGQKVEAAKQEPSKE